MKTPHGKQNSAKPNFIVRKLAAAIYIVGVFISEGPPVPIPNTEVKLTYAENTCLETDREDRSAPTQMSLMYANILGSHIPP